MIIRCSCKHTYQDKKYGKNRRVANRCGIKGSGGKSTFRCTVCLKEH